MRGSELLLFRQRDGPYIPTLRLLHKCECVSVCVCVCVHLTCTYMFASLPPPLTHTHTDPDMLPKVQVDKGAIKFLLSGANIMCPGLTSPGARMDVSLPEETVVVSPHIHVDHHCMYIYIYMYMHIPHVLLNYSYHVI